MTLPQVVSIRFNQDVGPSLTDADFQVTGPAGLPPHTFAYSNFTNTATLTFSSALRDGDYHVRALAPGILNSGNQPMAADRVYDFFVLAPRRG